MQNDFDVLNFGNTWQQPADHFFLETNGFLGPQIFGHLDMAQLLDQRAPISVMFVFKPFKVGAPGLNQINNLGIEAPIVHLIMRDFEGFVWKWVR